MQPTSVFSGQSGAPWSGAGRALCTELGVEVVPTLWMDSDGLKEAGQGWVPKPVLKGLRRQCPGREKGVVGPLGSSDPLAENGYGAGTRQAQHVCEQAHACSQLPSYTYIDSHMLKYTSHSYIHSYTHTYTSHTELYPHSHLIYTPTPYPFTYSYVSHAHRCMHTLKLLQTYVHKHTHVHSQVSSSLLEGTLSFGFPCKKSLVSKRERARKQESICLNPEAGYNLVQAFLGDCSPPCSSSASAGFLSIGGL